MSFLWLAVKDTLLIGRDKKALLMLIAMPLLLIGILGAAFGNLMSTEKPSIEPFAVGIVNHDSGPLGQILETDVFGSGIDGMIEVKPLNEGQTLADQVQAKQVAVGIVIPDDFSEAVFSGKQPNVGITALPTGGLQATIAENVISQFAKGAGIMAASQQLSSQKEIMDGIGTSAIVSPQPTMQPAKFALVEQVAVKSGAEPVGSFQYYAAGVGVMFLLMTVVNGVAVMMEEKEQDVYKRLLVSSLTYPQYLAGKLAGLLVLSILQLTVMVAGTTLIFDVEWGPMDAVAVTGLAYVFSASGLGVLIGSFMKNVEAFNAAGLLGTQILAAVGGSMVPIYVFPDWVNTVAKVFPNALALQTFIDLMAGGRMNDILIPASGMLASGLVFMVIAWIRLASERRRHYA